MQYHAFLPPRTIKLYVHIYEQKKSKYELNAGSRANRSYAQVLECSSARRRLASIVNCTRNLRCRTFVCLPSESVLVGIVLGVWLNSLGEIHSFTHYITLLFPEELDRSDL